jgi:hypothetical protein
VPWLLSSGGAPATFNVIANPWNSAALAAAIAALRTLIASRLLEGNKDAQIRNPKSIIQSMSQLIHQGNEPAIWSTAEFMSDGWSVCLPHQSEAYEKALFQFKQTQTNGGSIAFHSLCGSGILHNQLILKRHHEPLKEAKVAHSHLSLTLPSTHVSSCLKFAAFPGHLSHH